MRLISGVSLFGEERAITTDIYHSLWFTQHKQGDLASARRFKQHALDIKRKRFGGQLLIRADNYDLLGLTQREEGDLSSGLKFKRHAVT